MTKKQFRVFYYVEVELADEANPEAAKAQTENAKAAVKDEVENHVIFKAIPKFGVDITEV